MVSGKGYSVVTDSGAATAARMAARVETLHQLLGGSTSPLPLRIVLLGSENLFSSLRPSATVGGFYQSSAGEDWIVVRWGRPDGERAMSHELVHAALEHNGPRRPLWLEEGLAEFYSTAQLEGGKWTVGRPVEAHVRLLNQRAWLGEREFFEAQADSALREEGSRIGVFYAQSWAIVHYLLTVPGVREKTPALLTAMSEGQPFARACDSVLGLRQGLLLEAARRAVEQKRFATARLVADVTDKQAHSVVTLTASQAETLLVDLSLVSDRLELARRWARTPYQRGLLALRDGRRSEAERLFRSAIEGDGDEASPFFEMAMLLREEKREAASVARLLRSTIQRNPNHAEARFLLGLDAAADGDLETAIGEYQEAVRIFPRQATFWHALALILERAGRRAEAAHAAVRCRLAARNAAEREMAAGINRLVSLAAPEQSVAPSPREYVPESWRGLQGDSVAEGVVLDFNCETKSLEVRVATDGQLITLRVRRPGDVKITGTGSASHTFECGSQKAAVRVYFVRATMELTAVEFL